MLWPLRFAIASVLLCCNGFAADDFSFTRKPIADEQNAFVEWKKADAFFVPLTEPAKDAASRLWSPKGERLTAQQTELLRRCVQTNHPALELLEQSLAKPRAQIPAWNPVETGPFLRAPFELVKLRIFEAEEAALTGQHAAVTNLLLGNLKFARLLRDADVPLIHYLVARACRSSTEKALFRWAWFTQPPVDVLRGVVAQLPELSDEPDGYEHVLRVEFADFISQQEEVQKIAKSWAETARTNETVMALQPEELRRPLLLIFDPRLVVMHPKPLNVEEDKKFFGPRFSSFAAFVHGTWDHSRYDALHLQTEKIKDAFLAELQPLLKVTANEKLPLSAAAAKKARTAYLALRNPIGRYYEANDTFTRTCAYVFQARTERNATRALLALRVFQLEHGTLPKSLEELVSAHLLQKVPLDYFANAPLHYDGKALWSVGEDGTDDDGVAGASFWMEKDAVWKLPFGRRKD